MDLHVPDAMVTGYDELIPGLRMPGPDDRHVLAATICGGADVIATLNMRFPDCRAETDEFRAERRRPALVSQ